MGNGESLIKTYTHTKTMMIPTQASPAKGHFETGSLTQRAPHQSEFVGSSSGVHFIKLVRAAFANTAALDGCNDVETPPTEHEDIVGHGNICRSDYVPSQQSSRQAPVLHDSLAGSDGDGLMPSLVEARAMAVEYFGSWHPLLPFLYGPTFMRDLEGLYLDVPPAPTLQGVVCAKQRDVCYRFILRCLFATVRQDHTSISPSATLAVAGQLASHNDLLTLQAILMAQLRCVSAMALRMASSLSGLLSRLLLHAGLHRCPHRYVQLDSAARDLRKRIFWSAYIMDRYLSQALGLPPTIADSDVDVCAPGCPELHEPGRAWSDSQPSSHCAAADGNGQQDTDPPSPDRHDFLFAHLVTHGRIISRVLEIFHKSLHVRSVGSDEVLSIRTDANKWFNSLPQWPPRPGHPVLDQLHRPIKPEQARFVPFLHVLYQQVLIAIHRPYLSLPRASAEFGNSIQLVVRAARQTNALLSDVDDFFWPGYLAAAWMSGLILTFACQTKAFSVEQGVREVDRCLETLTRMEPKWPGAGRCHAALFALISDFGPGDSPGAGRNTVSFPKRPHSGDDGADSTRQSKRSCLNPSNDYNTSEYSERPLPFTVSQAWLDKQLTAQAGDLPDLGIETGDIFQNMTWDSGFSSIDPFATTTMPQDWLL